MFRLITPTIEELSERRCKFGASLCVVLLVSGKEWHVQRPFAAEIVNIFVASENKT